ncbi:MoxR family ATPase [Anabaena sp. UHCC 0253]|uniref:AAA family ATPase n=1 Tax=Anabaena sp. UHCC 0253 TaxID=2590019 RepID=UPI001445446D|nr:MoxR family ATPase [Anabaena sp. UHCC 0253]MTJ55632.1 MoxR family ATPase [Anabaena sp. UHCC 0253]
MEQLPVELEYTGKTQPPSGGIWNEQVNRKLYPYYPDSELKEAVKLAIQLNRPLLLEGEPGCGKSELARAVFYEFSQRTEENWHFRLWNIQSTSKAQDGFYSYDYIGRLQAAQLKQLENANSTNPEDYLEYGSLGHAFLEHGKTDNIKARNIVLIDEIDKADTDFPNDLLLALEDQCFEIKDVRPRRWLKANKDAPPIIFITSNQEKELPNAFLRRCLYHYVEFPKENELIDIIKGRFSAPPESLVNAAIGRFLSLREYMDDNKEETDKKVSTSELIDWFQVLNFHIRNDKDEIDEKN